jgi:hypothetical protein
MSRAELDVHFATIDALINEIDQRVPPNKDYISVKFRADLAGLLVVAMAATYENCVKEILCDYASKHHVAFGEFALRIFNKLNSRIQIRDLRKYCELFDPRIAQSFKVKLATKKLALLRRVGANIEDSYEQILSWRHEFAHAKIQKTTIEEATKTHRFGKRVLYVFDDVFG